MAETERPLATELEPVASPDFNIDTASPKKRKKSFGSALGSSVGGMSAGLKNAAGNLTDPEALMEQAKAAAEAALKKKKEMQLKMFLTAIDPVWVQVDPENKGYTDEDGMVELARKAFKKLGMEKHFDEPKIRKTVKDILDAKAKALELKAKAEAEKKRREDELKAQANAKLDEAKAKSGVDKLEQQANDLEA